MKLTFGMKTRNKLIPCSLILALAPAAFGSQAESTKPWSVLEDGVAAKKASERVAAVRVLGLIHGDSNATELAEKALKDPKAAVRVAAATALGQMHATDANAALKQALNDKQLSVVMAAAHALKLLNDPACYDVYYAFLTGQRKSKSGMVAQEMQVLHDPKEVAAMGFNQGIGYAPFAGMGWQAVQIIMKDKKSSVAAKAALISALSADPNPRVDQLLVKETQSPKWVLRVAALEAIAKRGNPALTSEIENALADSKVEVKDTAAATMIHLNGIREAHEDNAQSTLMVPQSEPELWRLMSQ